MPFDATRFLLDHMLRSPPHISAVVRHAGARYVAPHNPMQAHRYRLNPN